MTVAWKTWRLTSSEKGSDSYFDSDTLEEIASYYFEQGRFEESLRVVDRSLEMHPYSSDGWMRRGILLNNLGRHHEALEAYDEALGMNPTDIETLVNKGITLDSVDEPEKGTSRIFICLKSGSE